MERRDFLFVAFLASGVFCVISGLLSMYTEILTSWRYSVLCYVFFGIFVVFGYITFSDRTWYIKPVKSLPTKLVSHKPVSVTEKQSAKSVSSKSIVTSKVGKAKIESQKQRKGAKK